MPAADEPMCLPVQGAILVSEELLTTLLSRALTENRALLSAIVSDELARRAETEPSRPVSARLEWPYSPEEFGLAVRERREHAGLTRAQLSALSGVADSTIRNLEVHRHRPTARIRDLLIGTFKALSARLPADSNESDAIGPDPLSSDKNLSTSTASPSHSNGSLSMCRTSSDSPSTLANHQAGQDDQS